MTTPCWMGSRLGSNASNSRSPLGGTDSARVARAAFAHYLAQVDVLGDRGCRSGFQKHIIRCGSSRSQAERNGDA